MHDKSYFMGLSDNEMVELFIYGMAAHDFAQEFEELDAETQNYILDRMQAYIDNFPAESDPKVKEALEKALTHKRNMLTSEWEEHNPYKNNLFTK